MEINKSKIEQSVKSYLEEHPGFKNDYSEKTLWATIDVATAVGYSIDDVLDPADDHTSLYYLIEKLLDELNN